METEEEETLDLPMMSNRDISSVDHYIIDLSCDLKSKCFIGSITLFMQPNLKCRTLHPEINALPVEKSSAAFLHQCGATPKNIDSPQTLGLSTTNISDTKTNDTTPFSMKCIKNSEGVHSSETQELASSLTQLKSDDKTTASSLTRFKSDDKTTASSLTRLKSDDKTTASFLTLLKSDDKTTASSLTRLKSDDKTTASSLTRLKSDAEIEILNQQMCNPETIKSSAVLTQCTKTSEDGHPLRHQELSLQEHTPFLAVPKTDTQSKEGIFNQQSNNPGIDKSWVSDHSLKEDEKSLSNLDSNKGFVHLSAPVTNRSLPVLPASSQKTKEFLPPKDNYEIDHHFLLRHKSQFTQYEYNLPISSLPIKEAIHNIPLMHTQTRDPGLNDHTGSFGSTSMLTLEGNAQEKPSDKTLEGKRKNSDEEFSLNSKQPKIVEDLPFTHETSKKQKLPILVKDQISEVPEFAVAESEIPASSSSDISEYNQQFILILDACDILVSKVELLDASKCELASASCPKCQTRKMTLTEREKFWRFCSKKSGRNLRFATTKWSLRIWDEHPQLGGFDARSFFAVRIEYSTMSEGKSLKWVTDQDENMTAFTRGDFINNRSLFPSQDHPETLSTWQTYITVSEPNLVLMTGDKDAVVTQLDNGLVQFYYQSTMLMPSSTVALAVGQWQSLTIINSESYNTNESEKWIPKFCSQLHNFCSVNFSKQPTFPCRVFAPKCLMSQAEAEFQHYLARCLAEMYNVLGPHPFCRLDILIVPSCFESLGMANPCLIFLSESVLVGNLSFCSRLSHEVSHSWFGLVLGPKDWTEEWMTEGFASFLEDLVHPTVIGMNEKEAEDWFELRALIKHRVLTAELSHTEEDLQILRVNESDSVASKSDKTLSVKNGLNPDKKCLNVHYLKGYFLLRFFSQKVGLSPFKAFLKKYVQHFHGQLVTSQDFLQMFFIEFPELKAERCGFNEKQICDEWLDRPGLPKVLENLHPNKQVKLINDVYKQVAAIKWGMHSFGGFRLEPVCEDQLTLLLELLLDVPCSKSVLEQLYEQYHINKSNPDVRHRWCELVIQNKFTKFYKDVKQFLLHDQAMGIYLFGELMLSNSTKQKLLAEECFLFLKDKMDDRLRKSVQELIYR